MSTDRKCCICQSCIVGNGYTCPKCNITVCSLDCYRSQAHSTCSEKFYEQWVHESMKDDTRGDRKPNPIIQQLKAMRQEEEQTGDNLSDEDATDDDMMHEYLSQLKQLTVEGEEKEEDVDGQLKDMLGIDGHIDVQQLKSLLSDQEHQLFDTLIKEFNVTEQLDDIAEEGVEVDVRIDVAQPWWVHVTKPIQIVSDSCKYPVVSMPDLSHVKLPNEPSDTVAYSCINLVSAYCYMNRQNVDMENYGDVLLNMIGGEKHTFQDVSTAAVYPTVAMNCDAESKKRLICDVVVIVQNAHKHNPNLICTCLAHTREKLVQSRKSLQKDDERRKILFRVIKKLEYLIGWAGKFCDHFVKFVSELKIEALHSSIETESGDCDKVLTDNDIAASNIDVSKESKPKNMIEVIE